MVVDGYLGCVGKTDGVDVWVWVKESPQVFLIVDEGECG